MNIINFLNKTLHLYELESTDDAFVEKDTDSNIYRVYLPKDCSLHIIAHEAWHIFLDILSTYDNGTLSCLEMTRDIYAYSFDLLYRILYNFSKGKLE